jgi:hypothetical protein
LDLEPGVSNVVVAESDREALPGSPEDEKKKKKTRPHPGRQTLPADLPCPQSGLLKGSA